MAMKTSAFCKSRKMSCEKIGGGNTFHIKFKNHFLRAHISEEPMSWELCIFLSPISPFLQHRVDVQNLFRSILEDIQKYISASFGVGQ